MSDSLYVLKFAASVIDEHCIGDVRSKENWFLLESINKEIAKKEKEEPKIQSASPNKKQSKSCSKCENFVKSINHNYCSNCGRELPENEHNSHLS